jgi:hypothetical protein
MSYASESPGRKEDPVSDDLKVVRLVPAPKMVYEQVWSVKVGEDGHVVLELGVGTKTIELHLTENAALNLTRGLRNLWSVD